MKNKLISTQSSRLLAYFNQKSEACFDYSKAAIALPQSNDGAIRELLSDMVKRGLLMRLKRGLYYIIPYEQAADTFMPDWHLLATHLTKGDEYYIGYYSALQVHSLITQPSLKEQIVVAKQIRPSTLVIKSATFQFIYHNENHFFGAKNMWIDSFHKVQCSDLEKTLIDCLFKPDYAGGIVEVAKAIYASRDNIKFDKLLDYTQRFKSQAVTKRLGFLFDTLEIETGISKSLLSMTTPSYVLLDTELPKSGKLIRRWGIQQNVDTETIRSAIYT